MHSSIQEQFSQEQTSQNTLVHVYSGQFYKAYQRGSEYRAKVTVLRPTTSLKLVLFHSLVTLGDDLVTLNLNFCF